MENHSQDTNESIEQNHPAEVAHTLESLPVHEREKLWNEIPTETRGDVLPYLHDDARQRILDQMPTSEITQATQNMDAGDIIEVIDLLPDDVAQEVIDSLNESDKVHVQHSLQYDDDVAGRRLDYDTLLVTQHRMVGQVLNYIRKRKLPAYTDKIFIVGKNRSYLGAVALGSLLESEENTQITDLPLIINLDVVTPNMPLADVAALFRQKHYVSLPVVDEGRLLGRITLDDAIDVLQEKSDHQLMGMAGLNEEEDLFAPVLASAKRRTVWLGINLLTALLAAYVIGIFESALDKIVALAILMPIVASMGGIAGSQTLTLVIRAMALKQIHADNSKALFFKELGVGMFNGFIWAAGVGMITHLWFQDSKLSLIIALAITINLIAAAVAGIIIPLVLNRLKIDPALSGSVILTTVTDVVGFFCFLGLGSWWLL